MRIQLELSGEEVKELKDLMARAGIDTYKDLFNNALTLLEWAVDEAEERRTLASIGPEGERLRELAMPVLDRIVKRRNAAHREVSASAPETAMSPR